MVTNLLFYQLLLVALVLICLLVYVGWPDYPPRAPTNAPRIQQTPTQTLHRTHTLSWIHPQTTLRGL